MGDLLENVPLVGDERMGGALGNCGHFEPGTGIAK